MKYSLLLKQLGENSTTRPDPVALVVAHDGDQVTARRGQETYTVNLQAKTHCCISADWDMLTEVNLYALGEVEVPDWMTCDEYLSHQTEWKYYCGFGGQLAWPRQWFFRLIKLDESAKYAAMKLLNVKKFRSSFRMSLRSQLEAWLNDPEPRYQSPFSPRQWEVLLDGHTCLAAKRTAASLYWNR
jgi:hypothetical protein